MCLCTSGLCICPSLPESDQDSVSSTKRYFSSQQSQLTLMQKLFFWIFGADREGQQEILFQIMSAAVIKSQIGHKLSELSSEF